MAKKIATQRSLSFATNENGGRRLTGVQSIAITKRAMAMMPSARSRRLVFGATSAAAKSASGTRPVYEIATPAYCPIHDQLCRTGLPKPFGITSAHSAVSGRVPNESPWRIAA